jgi:CheY-like chemotaxis protein
MSANLALDHKPRVLIVDDSPDSFELLTVAARHCSTCAEAGEPDIEFEYAETPEEAVEKLNATCFDACLLDIRLKGFNGLNLGELIREHDVNVPLAYYTGLDSDEARTEALKQRAYYWLKGRFEHPTQLLKLIRELAQLNPCQAGGVSRTDNHGHARRLERTPIEIPEVLRLLIQYSSEKLAAAGG